jgi:hypothetical protein
MPAPPAEAKLRALLAWAAAAAILGVLFFFGLREYGSMEAAATGERAQLRFQGDPIEALIELAGCEACDLRDRNRAVWALGQLGDRRALPPLRRQVRGRPCNHAVEICQRELQKAIRKLEGSWALRCALGLRR